MNWVLASLRYLQRLVIALICADGVISASLSTAVDYVRLASCVSSVGGLYAGADGGRARCVAGGWCRLWESLLGRRAAWSPCRCLWFPSRRPAACHLSQLLQQTICRLWVFNTVITSPLGGVRSIVMSLSGCLLAICRPSGCTVASGVVVVVVCVCNRSQMRTSKCTCLIFGVSIGLDPG